VSYVLIKRPIFIVGAMRSGTTLLSNTLGRSDGIVHCPFELKDVWSEEGKVPTASPKTRDTKCPQLFASDVQVGQFESLSRAFEERYKQNNVKKLSDARFLNKNPHLCNKLEFVDALFPDAQYVWIYRLLPFVVASLKALFEGGLRRQQTWHYWPESSDDVNHRCWEAFHFQPPPRDIDSRRCFPGGDVVFLAEYWLESNKATAEFFSGVGKGKGCKVDFDRLIDGPGPELELIFNFLGMKVHPKLLRGESIDLGRNSVWAKRLDLKERNNLKGFVIKNETSIENVFPDENMPEKCLEVIESSIRGSMVFVDKEKSILGEGGRLVIGCVAENTPKYLAQALRLLQSVRWFGGSLAQADFILCVVEGVDSAYREVFESYGAAIRIVPRFSTVHPQSNKLGFLQQDDLKEYDHAVLLDCDVVVVRDPKAFFCGEGFAAKIADAATVPHAIFEKLFKFFEIPLPDPSFEATVTGERTIPYFNAGVLAFSRNMLDKFVPTWIELNRKLIENIDLLERHSNFCEQASLSLALAACRSPFSTLGNEANFPTHFSKPNERLEAVDPFLIHYHSEVDPSGHIKTTPYSLVNKRILQFNKRLREEREDGFDNRLFWNHRYAVDPKLGSGLG